MSWKNIIYIILALSVDAFVKIENRFSGEEKNVPEAMVTVEISTPYYE